ncbi:MAG: amino acid ABC transporter permease [Oscillospiraceae bacterium]|nr:amino acid ABC transporter permease [Oscillospiraceae bacterium]
MSERLLGILTDSFPKLLLSCLKVTIPLTVIIFLLSLVLGFLLALVQILNIKGLKQLARVYIWIFRGTPLLVQLYIVFFGLPSIGITLDAFTSAVIAFSLNSAAYNSETIRSAILSVPQGQIEAGYMVGLSYRQIMMRIVLPQAARVAFPTLFNSFIGLTKDTSLAASITVVELFKSAQQVAAVYFEPFALYCEAAVVYLMLNTLLTFLQSYLEKKLEWKPQTKRKWFRIPFTKEKLMPIDDNEQ